MLPARALTDNAYWQTASGVKLLWEPRINQGPVRFLSPNQMPMKKITTAAQIK